MRHTILFYLGFLALLPLFVTRLALGCPLDSNITMVPDVSASLGKRAISQLVTHERQPWPLLPRNGRQWRVITYCYDDPGTRYLLDCPIMREAIFRWEQKLHPNGPYHSTVNLRFEEANDSHHDPAQRQPLFCLAIRPDTGRIGWNINVPADTLRITTTGMGQNVNHGAQATVGYEWKLPGEDPGRHKLSVIPHPTLAGAIYDIAHELGHVMGMTHEHQRSDRDNYVYYNCRAVGGFAFALNAAQQARQDLAPDEVRRRLCNDKELAQTYNFAGTNFLTEDPARNEGPFDIDSMMMYGSGSFAHDRASCEQGNLQRCTLLKYGQRNGVVDRDLPMERFDGRRWPSDGDKRWVEKWYPA